MSGRNPYAVNGYQSSGTTRSQDDPYNSDTYSYTGPVNGYAPRDRRAGGWAGIAEAEGEESLQPLANRSAYGNNEDRERRTRAGRQSREFSDARRSWDTGTKSNGTNGLLGKGGNKGLEAFKVATEAYVADKMRSTEVLLHIQTKWGFMGREECVPVKVALQLMDPSTLGLASQEPDFQSTHVDLQTALKSIVNEHHQDFNSSIGTYHKIQTSIQNSQTRVRVLKNSLMDAKLGLLTTKPELKGLATSSQAFDDTLQLLSQVESIQAVPERLEGRISEKRFLTAVDVLQEALRLVRKSDFDGIGAIADLRTYFATQEQSLTDVLIEELHDHLYLKSPYCQDRWKTNPTDGDEKETPTAAMKSTGVNSWDRPVYHYISNLDTSVPMVEDASKNPEADTFYYIQLIIESLNRLGHLSSAVSRIEQRMPVELFKVVEKTNHEIDARYPSHSRGQLNRDKRQTVMSMDTNDGRGAVLSDFLWTLYTKFEAIAEGHRVVHEIVSGIVHRESLPNADRYVSGFKELWKLYQSEMRSLLHDYLAADGDMTLRSGLSNASVGNVFSRSQRDKTKRIFKLGEMDQRSEEMKGEQEDLDDILKSSVPGLVSKSRAKTGVVSNASRSAQDSTAAGHKLLIEPSVFNITLLLPPSLAFLQHLKDIVPVKSDIAMSTLTSFLDDFLINIFHPQLEEAVTDVCTKCINDLEAFTEDTQWSRQSRRPIFKGTIAFMSLIRAFSSMLNSIPQDQMFTQLIISQMVVYYDKCYAWYKALVSRLSPSSAGASLAMKTAAVYAESGEIHDVAAQLLEIRKNPGERAPLIDREIQLLLSSSKSKPLSAYDIISDPKSVISLSLLYNSLQWLSSSLHLLRHVDTSSSTSSHSRSGSKSHRRWTLINSLKPSSAHSKSSSRTASQVYLPLAAESVVYFDKTMQSFRNLATTAIITLHVDLRCGVLFQLSRSLQITNATSLDQVSAIPRDSSSPPNTDSGVYQWFLPQAPTSASPLILELNHDLISFDTNTSSFLGSKERMFIIGGLTKLIDRVLVTNADAIQVMNKFGAQRMGLDILVLQQNLLNMAVIAGPNNSSTNGGTAHNRLSTAEHDASTSSTQDHHYHNNNNTEDHDDNEESHTAILARSAEFYDLFLQGASRVIEFAKERKEKKKEEGGGRVGFSFDELRSLVELCYSSGLRSPERELNVRAKKALQDDLLALSEILWDD